MVSGLAEMNSNILICIALKIIDTLTNVQRLPCTLVVCPFAGEIYLGVVLTLFRLSTLFYDILVIISQQGLF